MAFGEDVAEMLLATRSAAGDDGDGERVREFAQGFVGVAVPTFSPPRVV